MKKHKIYPILDRWQEKLVNVYINEGPLELRKRLSIKADGDWHLIMNYLVYEKDVVKLCVRKNPDYIYDFFAEHGPSVLRKVFDIENSDFDEAWEHIMDYLGISRGALYAYVANNANEFKKLIYQGKPTQIREVLNINRDKYDRAWNEILDILLESVSTEKFSFSLYEQGIRMFANMYNQGRKHRCLKLLNKQHSEVE